MVHATSRSRSRADSPVDGPNVPSPADAPINPDASSTSDAITDAGSAGLNEHVVQPDPAAVQDAKSGSEKDKSPEGSTKSAPSLAASDSDSAVQAPSTTSNEASSSEKSDNNSSVNGAALLTSAADYIVTSTNARGHVRVACTNCRKRHLACDTQRPCHRCMTLGLECVNGEHKKRGRPRLKGRAEALLRLANDMDYSRQVPAPYLHHRPAPYGKPAPGPQGNPLYHPPHVPPAPPGHYPPMHGSVYYPGHALPPATSAETVSPAPHMIAAPHTTSVPPTLPPGYVPPSVTVVSTPYASTAPYNAQPVPTTVVPTAPTTSLYPSPAQVYANHMVTPHPTGVASAPQHSVPAQSIPGIAAHGPQPLTYPPAPTHLHHPNQAITQHGHPYVHHTAFHSTTEPSAVSSTVSMPPSVAHPQSASPQPSMHIDLSVDGTIIGATEETARALGFNSQRELLHHSILTLLHPKQVEYFQRTISYVADDLLAEAASDPKKVEISKIDAARVVRQSVREVTLISDVLVGPSRYVTMKFGLSAYIIAYPAGQDSVNIHCKLSYPSSVPSSVPVPLAANSVVPPQPQPLASTLVTTVASVTSAASIISPRQHPLSFPTTAVPQHVLAQSIEPVHSHSPYPYGSHYHGHVGSTLLPPQSSSIAPVIVTTAPPTMPSHFGGINAYMKQDTSVIPPNPTTFYDHKQPQPGRPSAALPPLGTDYATPRQLPTMPAVEKLPQLSMVSPVEPFPVTAQSFVNGA